MKPHAYTSLSNVATLIRRNCLCSEMRKDSPTDQVTKTYSFNDTNIDENLDFDEVFADHILMEKRLRKTLYGGNFFGLEEIPDHPPIALTGLAADLFSKTAPNYGLDVLDMDYVSAASEAARISPCAMIIAMIYLERLQLTNSEYLEAVSPPGLFVVTMLVASKFLFEDEEDIATNQMWAEALNLEIKDLNLLEREFLSAIDWKIFVKASEYLRCLDNVEKVIAIKQSSLRNWLSYSDLCVLCQDPEFQLLWKWAYKKLLKSALLWTLGYAATALALCGTLLAFSVQNIEVYKTSNLTVQEKVVNIQNSTLNSVHSLYKINMFSQGTQKDDKAFTSVFPDHKYAWSDKKTSIFLLIKRNYHSAMPTVKQTSSIYTVNIPKVFSTNKIKINASYFLVKPHLLPSSHICQHWPTYTKSFCPSVPTVTQNNFKLL